MAVLHVRLFGRFEIQRHGQSLAGLDAKKAQELLCYLFLYRDRPHPRETLAGLLWDDHSTAQAKKYLRQALWQLQATLDTQGEHSAKCLLVVDRDWIHLNPAADLWLDVDTFERACAQVQDMPGAVLDAPRVQALCDAVDLYRGDLLEGCFQDWCLYERERLQNMYLVSLDKLMEHCEAQSQYEVGLAHGARILCLDHARERTHRQMMRLCYLAGDRTAALRQYERCVSALRQELDVGPSKRTMRLYDQIRSDRMVGPFEETTEGHKQESEITASALSQALGYLKLLQTAFSRYQHQLERAIQAIETALNGQT